MVEVKGKQMRKAKTSSEAFTLIEMLIVVMIMGIIMGIAVLGFSGVNRASIIKSCKVDYLSVQSALNSFKNDNPPPTSISGSLDLYADSSTLVASSYMSKLPDNRTKYTITISTDPSALPTVVAIDPSVASKCIE